MLGLFSFAIKNFVLSRRAVYDKNQSARREVSALPSLSKVRRMGAAHPHARNYKRWATHKASMRASCDSIEVI